jgi:membrane protease YdiL (CAAX protease family)
VSRIDTLTTGVEEWKCACGRVNPAGLSLCPHCGRVPPRGIARQTTVLHREVDDWRPRVRTIRLALAVVGFNILFRIIVAGLVASGQLETNRATNVALWGGLIFYAFVLLLIVGPLFSVRPRWVAGERHTAALFGAEAGVATALVVMTIGWLIEGRPNLDPNINAVVSEGTVTRIALATLVAVIAAPVVEELLFRGVVAEGLREKGTGVAIFVSALLFALAHLLWTPFYMAYYTLLGVLLGAIYWRRGLQASMAAHAGFNGFLLLLCAGVALGPGHTFNSNGVSVHASGGWQQNTASGADLKLNGPGGATFTVSHGALGPNVGFDLQAIADGINGSRVPLPEGVSIVGGSAHVVTFPTGQGVEVSAVDHGHAGELIFVPKAGQVFTVIIGTAGSHRAKNDYPHMLQSLVLPNE